MTIEVVNPEGSQRLLEQFHFSQAAWCGDVLLCSGQIGMEADGRVPPTAEAEFRNAWNAVGAVLAAAGLGFGDLVEYTSYHVGLRGHMREFTKVRDEFVKAPWPAWTAIGVSELAVLGARVEIRAIARRS